MNRTLYAGLRLLISLSCLAARVNAQSPEQLELTNIGQDPRWKIANRTATVMEIKGKRAVKLSESPGVGVVWLDGYDFVNGVIDVDILGRSQPVQGSFVGVVFRAVDAETHDAVYFRPFNFSRYRLGAPQPCGAIRVSPEVAMASSPVGTPGRVRTGCRPRS